MKRVVEAELLDELPPQDSGAAGSRRDLQRLNHLLGHAQILGRLLESSAQGCAFARIVELGAGDGSLMLQLARHFAKQWPRVDVILVDKHDVVDEQTRREFSALGWKVTVATADVFAWLSVNGEPVDAVFANLFLHHFSEERLRELFRLVAARAKIFAAAEPRRVRLPLALSRLAGCIGCNAVTRHDIVLSVRAGFSGRELSALWPADSQWHLRESSAGFCSHVFAAARRD